MKHYYAQQAVSLDDNRLIANPKVGVSYQRSFWQDQLDASPTDIERLNRELEKTLLSVLAEAGAKAIEVAERGLDQLTSAFIAWAAKHDIDIRDPEGDELRLEFGVVDDTKRKLREGYELWTAADMPEDRYRMAKVQYKKEIDSGLRPIDKTETKSFASVAWHHLG